MKKTKKKLRRLQFFSWFFLLGPITAYMGYLLKDYFTWETGLLLPQGVELGLGVIMAGTFGILVAINRMDVLKKSRFLWAMAIICTFLQAIIYNATIIFWILAPSSTIFYSLQKRAKETEEEIKDEKSALRHANANERVYKSIQSQSQVKFNGRG